MSNTGYHGNIMITLIPAMFAKNAFKLTIVQVTSSYCAILSPQLIWVTLKSGRVGRNTGDSSQVPVGIQIYSDFVL